MVATPGREPEEAVGHRLVAARRRGRRSTRPPQGEEQVGCGPGRRRRPCGARDRRSSRLAGRHPALPQRVDRVQVHRAGGPSPGGVDEVRRRTRRCRRSPDSGRSGCGPPASRGVPAVHRVSGPSAAARTRRPLLRPGPDRRGRIGRRQHLVHVASPSRTRPAGPRRRAEPAPGSRRGSWPRRSTMKPDRCDLAQAVTRSACVQPGSG